MQQREYSSYNYVKNNHEPTPALLHLLINATKKSRPLTSPLD